MAAQSKAVSIKAVGTGEDAGAAGSGPRQRIGITLLDPVSSRCSLHTIDHITVHDGLALSFLLAESRRNFKSRSGENRADKVEEPLAEGE